MYVSLFAIGSALVTNVLATACWRDTQCTGPAEAAFPGPWEANIYAPETRNVAPKSILTIDGDNYPESAQSDVIYLQDSNPALVFDFGVEVGGIVSFNYQLAGVEIATVGLAMSESKDFIGVNSDSSRGGSGGRPGDGPFLFNLTREEHEYVLPVEKMRGGFRYLTVFLDSPEPDVVLEVADVRVEISFQPTWPNLRAYQGYFHSDDELLNKIWYSGAYTVQTNSAPGNTGQYVLDGDEKGWQNDAVITTGATVLLDGAKRDRFVWSGDLGTAVPAAFFSTGELESTKNAIIALFDHQNDEGVIPKSAPPYVRHDSDTYHLWGMIGTFNYFIYSGDEMFLRELWPKYEKALQYALSLVNENGIVSVKQEADWGRITYAKERASASMLLYRVLSTTEAMQNMVPGLARIEDLPNLRQSLHDAIQAHLWDAETGAFRDSPDSDLHPQDANSMAVAFGIVDRRLSDSQQQQQQAGLISDYLASRWTPLGPECPELPRNVSPFMSSVELAAHFGAGRPARALDLARRLWGWYLGHENGTQSTAPEGFLVDGGWGYRFNKGYTNGPAYMSHAHSWGSGPTSALTEYLLGLRVTGPAGREWVLQPAGLGVDDLAAAARFAVQAGFSTKLGKFSAKLSVVVAGEDGDGDCVLVEWDTPAGTSGVVKVPGMSEVKVEGGEGRLRIPIA